MGIKVTRICPVDIDGNFQFDDYLFQISAEDKRYEVYNKAEITNGRVTNDYTNDSLMDVIKVVLEENEPVMFYDENTNPIDAKLITLVKMVD